MSLRVPLRVTMQSTTQHKHPSNFLDATASWNSPPNLLLFYGYPLFYFQQVNGGSLQKFLAIYIYIYMYIYKGEPTSSLNTTKYDKMLILCRKLQKNQQLRWFSLVSEPPKPRFAPVTLLLFSDLIYFFSGSAYIYIN